MATLLIVEDILPLPFLKVGPKCWCCDTNGGVKHIDKTPAHKQHRSLIMEAGFVISPSYTVTFGGGIGTQTHLLPLYQPPAPKLLSLV